MGFTTAINTSLLTTYLIKKFIPALEYELVYQKFATPAVIPPGQGKVGRFNVFSNPPGTTSAIAELSTTANEITTLTTTGTDVTIAEYGEFIKVSELQSIAAVKGTRDELASRMAYGGGLALDSLVRAQATAVAAGQAKSVSATSPYYVAGTTKPTYMTAAGLMGAKSVLTDVGAIPFSGIAGHPDGALAGIIAIRAEVDLTAENTTGYMTWGQAVTNVPGMDGQKRWVKGYMGECYGVACYRSQNTGADITVTSLCENSHILSKGWGGAVGFGDMKAKIIINDVNSPYKSTDSIAWHAYFGTGLIDGTRAVRLYSLNA